MNQSQFERSQLVNALKGGDLPSNLLLAWQPIYAMPFHAARESKSSTEQAIIPDPVFFAAEALLRYRTNDGQLASAGFLVESAEQVVPTASIDLWVLQASLSFLHEHRQQLGSLSFLSVNIAPASLNQDDFLDQVLCLLAKYPNEAAMLCLEFTEGYRIHNMLPLKDFVLRCRSMGVKIALDDFGAGFNNFRYAIDLHLDMIKIDGSIVQALQTSHASRAVVSAILNLCNDLGFECIAEWVEDETTLKHLDALGVHWAQGHHMGAAIEPKDFMNQHWALV